MTSQKPQSGFDSEDEDNEIVSKTQLKKEADALKKLGLEILNLTPGHRESLPLDKELLDAFELATRINRKKDGFRRQIQFIGKLLRQRDIQPLELALNQVKASHQTQVDKFHDLEIMREKIIREGDDEIQKFVNEYPLADRQKLRHLVRQANKEAKQDKPPAASRELFKYLREVVTQD